MEYFSPTQSVLQRKSVLIPEFSEDNPYNVCSEFAGIRLATCLFEIHGWWKDAAYQSPQDVERFCSGIDDQEAREFCFIGYGNARGPLVANSVPYCDEFVVAEHQALCRAGALWAAEHHYNVIQPLRACEGLSEEYSQLCLKKGRFTCEVEKNCVEEGAFDY